MKFVVVCDNSPKKWIQRLSQSLPSSELCSFCSHQPHPLRSVHPQSTLLKVHASLQDTMILSCLDFMLYLTREGKSGPSFHLEGGSMNTFQRVPPFRKPTPSCWESFCPLIAHCWPTPRLSHAKLPRVQLYSSKAWWHCAKSHQSFLFPSVA